MFINKRITTNRNFFFAKPSYSLTNIFHIFTCSCYNYIALCCLSQFLSQL